MIRFAVEGDLPQILEVYAPYVLNTAYSFEYTVPTLEVFTQRFRDITALLPWLVWEEDGQVLGYAYASRPWSRPGYSWDAEISIYLAPQIHGKGIGRKLCTALEEILWRQGYRCIYSVITSSNEGSIAFHKHLGYRFVAEFPGCGYKHGQRLGTVWLEKQANFVDYPYSFPVPWYTVVENDGELHDILDSLSLS